MVVSMRVSRVSWLASLAWVVLLSTARLESGLDTRSSISTSVWGLGADYDPPAPLQQAVWVLMKRDAERSRIVQAIANR